MDPLFWILAGIVIGCVIGIIIIWRLEAQATRRAADNRRVEAAVSARLKIFDPRADVEEIDTRPIPAAGQPDQQTPRPPQPSAPSRRAAEAQPREQADAQPTQASATPLPEIQIRPTPAPAPAAQANGKSERPIPAEVLQATPERAWLRATELSSERRYVEQVIEDQQARLEELLHHDAPRSAAETAIIGLLQNELAQHRQRLEQTVFLEACYRQVAVPSLEHLAREYKKAASPQTPRAFGVRRHSLARIEPPGQNPPAPPTQEKPDS